MKFSCLYLLLFLLIVQSCTKDPSNPPAPNWPQNPSPGSTTKKDSLVTKFSGFYRVEEHTSAYLSSPGNRGWDFTYLGRIRKWDDNTITFHQYRRNPVTWWNMDFNYKFYNRTDSLITPYKLSGAKVLNDSTLKLWYYTQNCFDQFTVTQIWHRIRNLADTSLYPPEIPVELPNIVTIAGTDIAGNCGLAPRGDYGPAVKAGVHYPTNILVDKAGNVLYADNGAGAVRIISTDGIIKPFAGNYTVGFSGDGGPATNAQMAGPTGLATDTNGNVYITDRGNSRIRKVDANGIITTIAGTGIRGYSGDGGPALQANLGGIQGITLDAAGTIYVSDNFYHVVRKIATNGIITTVAGTGTPGFSGDGGPATSAQLSYPMDLLVDAGNNLYIAEQSNNRLRKVSSDGNISTFAGNGIPGSPISGVRATEAPLNYVNGVAADENGNIYIASDRNNQIYKISPDGILTTVAGIGLRYFFGAGPSTYCGDNGPAIKAALEPKSLFIKGKSLYLTDTHNSRIRKIQLP